MCCTSQKNSFCGFSLDRDWSMLMFPNMLGFPTVILMPSCFKRKQQPFRVMFVGTLSLILVIVLTCIDRRLMFRPISQRH